MYNFKKVTSSIFIVALMLATLGIALNKPVAQATVNASGACLGIVTEVNATENYFYAKITSMSGKNINTGAIGGIRIQPKKTVKIMVNSGSGATIMTDFKGNPITLDQVVVNAVVKGSIEVVDNVITAKNLKFSKTAVRAPVRTGSGKVITGTGTIVGASGVAVSVDTTSSVLTMKLYAIYGATNAKFKMVGGALIPGRQVNVFIPAGITIRRNAVSATLAQIQPNDYITLYAVKQGNKVTASKLIAFSSNVRSLAGKISEISTGSGSQTISIKRGSGTPVKFTVTADTVIRIGQEAKTITDLVVGKMAVIAYYPEGENKIAIIISSRK